MMKKKNVAKIFLMILVIFIISSSIIPVINAAESSGDIQSEYIETANYKQIILTNYDEQGNLQMEVNLLRSVDWVCQMDAKVGGFIWLSLPEKGINDWFLVENIQPITIIDSGSGNRVTGLFRSYGDVLNIAFVSGESFECTYGHRFYSLAQNDWIPAEELTKNEQIRTKDGYTTIQSIEHVPGAYEVFNLEVTKDHSYIVTSNAIIAHNDCAQADISRYLFNPEKPGALILPGGKKTLAYSEGLARYDDIITWIKMLQHREYKELKPSVTKKRSWSNLFDQFDRETGVVEIGDRKAAFISLNNKIVFNPDQFEQGEIMRRVIFNQPTQQAHSPNPRGASYQFFTEYGPHDEFIYAASHPGFDIKNYPSEVLQHPKYGNIGEILTRLRYNGAVLTPADVERFGTARAVHMFEKQGDNYVLHTFRIGIGWEFKGSL